MNHRPEERGNCDAVKEDLTEFALGTLSGRSRSQVLDHVATCPHCTAELESLAVVADTMLWLAPEAEPPLGFETRLVERFRGSNARRTVARWRRATVLAVAATLVAVLGIGVGAVTMTHGGSVNPAANTRPTMARLTSHGRVLGQVFLTSGNPSWLIMTVDAGSLSGAVWCEVTLASGRSVTIGEFALSRGYGSWVAPINALGSQVKSARLVDPNGAVLASASLKA